MKEEALGCCLWRTRFVEDYGPVLRQYVMVMTLHGMSAKIDTNDCWKTAV
jgi:hypothetical protein